jgi:hypothetical protein
MWSILFSYPGAIICIVGGVFGLRYLIKNRKEWEKGDSIIGQPLIQGYFALIGFIIVGFIILYNLIFNKEW